MAVDFCNFASVVTVLSDSNVEAQHSKAVTGQITPSNHTIHGMLSSKRKTCQIYSVVSSLGVRKVSAALHIGC